MFLGEKQRSIEREIDRNENQIAQRPYIKKPVNLDRCRCRKVSRDLSRRCRENAHRQLRCQGTTHQNQEQKLDRSTRCRGAVEDTNQILIDPPGIEKLSSIQTQSPSIHQVSRCKRNCNNKKLRKLDR